MPPIIIAATIAAGAGVAQNVYATRTASKQNNRALDAEERDAERSAALEREDRASREQAYQKALDADQRKWEDYVRVHEPYWQTGREALGRLQDLAGLSKSPQGASGTAPPGRQPLQSVPRASGGPMGSPVGLSAGRRAFQATRMPIPQSGGGQSLQSLMEIARMFPESGPQGRLPARQTAPSLGTLMRG